ncbi:hypothetical protein TNCV_4831871 [Trichonephila clavipes]|nr:hypothetical protein TNCV_4831871 [Trichonephila clavipes]
MSFSRPGSGRPRTDQSSRRPPHCKKWPRVQPNVSASSVAIQAQVEPSLEAPVSSRNKQGAWLKDIWSVAPITCVTLDAHPSMPPFGVVPRMEKLGFPALEGNQIIFSDEFRFNLSSETIVFVRNISQVVNRQFCLCLRDNTADSW